MATWTTTETETRERQFYHDIRVVTIGGGEEKWRDPTPADYIAALIAEPLAVRDEVMEGIADGDAYVRMADSARKARADLATVTAERDAARAELEAVTKDRDSWHLQAVDTLNKGSVFNSAVRNALNARDNELTVDAAKRVWNERNTAQEKLRFSARHALESERDEAKAALATVTAERDAALMDAKTERATADNAINAAKAYDSDRAKYRAELLIATAERDSLRARLAERETQLATATAEEISLRSKLEGAVKAIAAEDVPELGGCPVGVFLNQDKKWVSLFGNGYKLWAQLPRVLAAIAKEHPSDLLAAADKLREVAGGGGGAPTDIVGEWRGDAIVIKDPCERPWLCRMRPGNEMLEILAGDYSVVFPAVSAAAVLSRSGFLPVAPLDRETRAVLALVEWTRGGDRLMAKRASGGFVTFFSEAMGQRDGEGRDTALALCDKLGIKVE